MLLKFSSLILALSISVTSTAQIHKATVAGQVKDFNDKSNLPFVTAVLKLEKDTSLVMGTITNEEGRFTLASVADGNYILEFTYVGYKRHKQNIFVGSLSDYLDLGTVELTQDDKQLDEVTVTTKQDAISGKLDKKTFDLNENSTQAGGSVLQAIKNLPGITTDQDGKVQVRGSDKVMVLIDGKQTALTGYNNQSGLDNIPASAIDKIEIINNPSAKYDANGNAGIINIIYKKSKQTGWSGKAGLIGGIGALWVKRENYPGIRPQYQNTPKINPSLALNYRQKKINVFLQGDYLYSETLNKNEFVDRFYDDGQIIRQQTKRNRNTGLGIVKSGLDWNRNENDMLSFSTMFSSEKIIDNGDEPFFNQYGEQLRLWQFLEDELKTTITASSAFQHKYKQPGRILNISLNYTFHRENEKYFFTNYMPTFTGKDAFKLISDEHVGDCNIDYIRPLKFGKFETGVKYRQRYIPTNMQFIPGLNSPLDTASGGPATYAESIPATYFTYAFENKKFEAEAGLRMEYVNVHYEAPPNHPVYQSDGYSYFQPFPNARFGYKVNDKNKFSAFYNRRVDRPGDVDIRVFPKYDDAEIVKVGNPSVKPQFTNSFELAYKRTLRKGYFYSALYYRLSEGTITRIAVTAPGSPIIYNIIQNAGKSNNTGLELMYAGELSSWMNINVNGNIYQNTIEAFSVVNKYPITQTFNAEKQSMISGNLKINSTFHLPKKVDVQVLAVYLAPDVVPQGSTDARYYIDLGLKKSIQNGKGEIFANATDVLNTLRIKKTVYGNGFHYISQDYYETQVLRVGYSYKF